MITPSLLVMKQNTPMFLRGYETDGLARGAEQYISYKLATE